MSRFRNKQNLPEPPNPGAAEVLSGSPLQGGTSARTFRAEGARPALASAVHRVANLYVRTPGAKRPDVQGPRWTALEEQVDRAFAEGNDAAALTAIRRWEDHARREMGWPEIGEEPF